MRGGLVSNGRLGARGTLTGFGGRPRMLVALGLLLVALLIAGALTAPAALSAIAAPKTLEQTHLVGARTPNCVRLVVLPDMSGSMVSVAPVREAALRRFMRWAPGNLRSTDELVIVPWDDRAVIALPATAVHRLDARRYIDEATGGSGSTDVRAALRAVSTLPPTSCATHLAFISDGQIPNTPSVQHLLSAGHVESVAIVLPQATTPPSTWTALFPGEEIEQADSGDQQQTALAVARIVAAATGQRLEKR